MNSNRKAFPEHRIPDQPGSWRNLRDRSSEMNLLQWRRPGNMRLLSWFAHFDDLEISNRLKSRSDRRLLTKFSCRCQDLSTTTEGTGWNVTTISTISTISKNRARRKCVVFASFFAFYIYFVMVAKNDRAASDYISAVSPRTQANNDLYHVFVSWKPNAE